MGDSPTSIRGSQRLDKMRFVIRTTTEKYNACNYLAELDVQESEPLLVEITPWEQKRSELQNSYLWGWLYRYTVDKLAESGQFVLLDDGREYPYDAELLHDIFKERFLCYDILVRDGKERKKCYSTTELLMRPKPGQEQRGFKYYVDSIKHFVFSYWGIDVPPTYNEDFRSLERDMEHYR